MDVKSIIIIGILLLLVALVVLWASKGFPFPGFPAILGGGILVLTIYVLNHWQKQEANRAQARKELVRHFGGEANYQRFINEMMQEARRHGVIIK